MGLGCMIELCRNSPRKRGLKDVDKGESLKDRAHWRMAKAARVLAPLRIL